MRGWRVGLGALVVLAGLSATACGAGSRDDSPPGASVRAVASLAAAPASAAAVPASTAAVPASAAPGTASPVATSSPTRKPVPNPCAGNPAGRQWVRVSIASQHLWMCTGTHAVYSTGITSGIPTEDTHTPTGTYTIQAKVRDTTLTLNTGQTYQVQYWIPFEGPLFGFHDSSWQTFPYGSQRYRTDGSHGCVHMPLAAIAYLYRWAPVGTAVTIR